MTEPYERARRRLAEAGLGRRPASVVPADGTPAPLSYPQLEVWLAAHLHPQSAAYSMPAEHLIRGSLDVPALEAALQAVVERQDVLRSRFVAADGEPMQFSAGRPELGIHDLRTLPPVVRDRRLAELRRHHSGAPFSLADEPPLRADLVRLADEIAVLLLTLHHIAADGWSFDVLHQELAAAYRGEALGPLPLRYADFAGRQRAAATAPARRPVAGADTPLPGTFEVSVGPTQPGATFRRPVDGRTAERVAALARRRGRSRFAVLTAALVVVLARYTGRPAVVVATPLSGRVGADTLELVGMFLNTALLRLDLAGDPTYGQLTDQVQAAVTDALRDEAEPHAGHRPYRVLVTHRADGGGLILDGVQVEERPVRHETAKVDLRVEFLERAGGLSVDVTYSTDRLASATAERFGRHLTEALAHLADHPDRPVSTLPLRVPPDPASAPGPSRLVDRLRAVIADQPGAPAIRGPAGELTYADLGRRCAVLAGHLAAGPPGPVAVRGGNDVGTAVAMVAVLLTGRTLVPLDRDLPVARQASMAARVGHLLQVGPGRTTGTDHITAVDPGTGLAAPAPAPELDPAGPAPDDPAYIVFTSGTTGGPRGLLGSYAGLAHFLDWQRGAFAVGPADRVSFLTSISFDVVFRELLLPLLSGSVLCVPGPDRGDPDALLSWLARAEVTLLHAVPTNLGFWLDRSSRALPRVRALFSAGEPLPAALVRRWRHRAPDSAVVNLYGPAETSLAKCAYLVPDPPQAGVQPVGTPLPGVRVRIARGRAPTGLPGEIELSPPFRPLGYLDGDPDNRFSAEEDRTWFQTGDLGRRRPDGLVEVLGRLDRQVKIRGVRVEPDEVAAVLAQHSAVAAAAVRAWPGADGPALAGYVVPARPVEGLPAILRADLAATLPTAMVPEHLVVLSELPRTARGKVDHAALPEPSRAPEPTNTGDPYAGGSAAAQVVVAAWSEVLAVLRPRPTDDFFQSGGHSLLGLQLTARLRQRLGVDLSVAQLFAAATLGDLVELVDRQAPSAPAGSSDGPWPRTARPAPTQTED